MSNCNCTCNNGYVPMPDDPTTMMRCPHCAERKRTEVKTSIVLQPKAWADGAKLAVERHADSMGRDSTNEVKNKRFGVETEINQVCGVIAAAQMLRVSPVINIGTNQPDMAGPYRVRHSAQPKAKLRVTNEPSDMKIVQVIGSKRNFKLTGYITAGEARRIGQRERLNNSEAECYTVPQSLLHPITELK